jgi:hypothetical protein
VSDNGQQGAPRRVGPRINISTLKIRELVAIEEKVGHKVAREIATFDFSADTVQALVWVALRRDNPEATYEDAGELDFDQLMQAVEGPEDPEPDPPTGPGGSPGPDAEEPTPTGSSSGQPSSAPPPFSGSSTA